MSIALFFSCEKTANCDLSKIVQSGKLVAVTLPGSTSYFEYRGEEMGFDYELCREFADSLGVELEMVVASNVLEMLEMLQSGDADMIAFRLGITQDLKQELAFSSHEFVDNQVLVQRRGRNVITNVVDLIGKDIHVNRNNRMYKRLKNLNDELGGGINICVVGDSIRVDDLIEMVSRGQIKYTIAPNDIAKLGRTFYKNIDIGTPVSFAQRSAWAVRKKSPLLLEKINAWFDNKQATPSYASLYSKYFKKSKYYIEKSSTVVIPRGAISPYDDLFKEYAANLGWDWELLAAMAYHESKFDTTKVSWMGARGLMQLMPRTAAIYGLTELEAENPRKSIDAATQHLKSLNMIFRQIDDREERIKFMLAAYNSGVGHVFDARALAEKHGKDPQLWFDNTEVYIRLKNKKEYYNDPVVKHGYMRGEETYAYVWKVLEKTEEYKRRTGKLED